MLDGAREAVNSRKNNTEGPERLLTTGAIVLEGPRKAVNNRSNSAGGRLFTT